MFSFYLLVLSSLPTSMSQPGVVHLYPTLVSVPESVVVVMQFPWQIAGHQGRGSAGRELGEMYR